MSKHTDGPWHVVDQFDDMDIFVSSVHGQVATCEEHRGIWKETAKANAHLISAAPELLEALEALVKRRDEACEVHGIHRKDGSDGRYEKARAAISKAKGETK